MSRPPVSRPHPLVELTRARLLEFIREPEAIFWVFIFPVLLAVALGIAFRTKPVDKLHAAVLRSDPAAGRLAALLSGSADLTVLVVTSAEAPQALRSGKIDVIVEGSPDRDRRPLSLTYRYDTARPEGRAARLAADAGANRTQWQAVTPAQSGRAFRG